uniref:hypothetical protein n=1 Tax=Campylobacter pinnipediorum TaxID=1965231 RepID=UPI0018E99767
MKISKIACGALLGTMIAINAYGNETSGSSFDNITNIQKDIQAKKQELEKASQDQDGYTNKFEKDKKVAEKEKQDLEIAKEVLKGFKKDLEGFKKDLEGSQEEGKEQFLKALDDKITQQEKKIVEQDKKIAEQKDKADKAKKALEAQDPEERAKIIADFNKELDAKMEEAKKDRAKVIVADKSLKLNSNESQTFS